MPGVAMFNNSGQFLQWVSKRRAVCLLFADQATAVNPTNEIWHSPSKQIAIPKGILLKTKADKFYREQMNYTRDRMMKRDNHTCQYCSKKGGQLTVDHIVPQSKGGKDSWTNCVAACGPCNHKKGNKSLEESGLKLLRKPTQPKATEDSEIWEIILSDGYDPDDSSLAS
jgi:5-methylcytosine-specific restriction endonuclease McrA